ncbi:MAG TPA: 50S ribosome-binding GTPase [Candidatus Megamonas gallistercoris]|nr:50S ribosome-binding GTPase [Candidatus Megamonas gallistercoris]
MRNIDFYVEGLERKIEQIKRESANIYIVNAGRMNHGKSSLFNSLLDEEIFKVGDIRMTKSRQNAMLSNNVYLVDTPGLDADENDDAVAIETYKKANMVVFVHTPEIGELHKDEINSINKIASLFPSKDYFWKHFCLVFTFKEKISAENLASIKSKILQDIKIHCGGENFPVFEVSNSRYQKGRRENKTRFVELSGIEELKLFLLKNVKSWQQDIEVLRNKRIERLKEEARNEMLEKRCQVQRVIDVKRGKIAIEKNRLVDLVEDFHDEIVRLVKAYCKKNDEVETLEKMIDKLETRHKKEINDFIKSLPSWVRQYKNYDIESKKY